MSGNTLGSAFKWLFLLGCGAGLHAAREAGDPGVEGELPAECPDWKMGFQWLVRRRVVRTDDLRTREGR